MQFTIRNKNYLLIEVPSDVTWWEIVDNSLGSFITKTLSLNSQFLIYGKSSKILGKIVNNKQYVNPNNFYLPEGKWDIINKLSEILQNEELCSEIVESYGNPEKRYIDYMNYVSKLKSCDFSTAAGSFKSFIQSINVDMSKEYLLIQKI